MSQMPLLMEDLSEGEQLALASMTHHPGYPALEKLVMAACDRANKALLQLDPAEEGYDQKVRASQSKARERNEFSLLILQSIQWHVKAQEITAEEKKAKPVQNPITKGIQ